MLGFLQAAWNRLFPERHIAVVSLRAHGRVRHLSVPGWLQVGAVVAVLGAGAGIVGLTAGYIEFDRLVQAKEDEVANKEAEVLQAELSNADLREIIGRLQERNGVIGRELDQARLRLAATGAQSSALRGQLYTAELRLRNVEEASEQSAAQRDEALQRLAAAEEQLSNRSLQLTQLGRALDAARTELRQTDSQRGSLAARLKQIETEAASGAKTTAQLRAAVEGAEKRMQQAAAERDGATAEREKLRSRVADLEQRLKLAGATMPSGNGSPVTNAAARATEPGKGGWGEIERVLSSAGVDVDKLLQRFSSVPAAQGGPFVAFDPLKRRASEIPIDTLGKVLKSLPLAAPLDDYQLESRFGVRVDPFNRKKSMHSGLDFSAPYRSPVLATAPGTVIHAGPKGDYGRVVEIDHGSGIVTRYAHLHRTNVVVGQRLAGREQIGQLGSSGRSSGPHVHYEILVNGVPQDPERFLNAGRSALQAAKAK